MTVSRMRNEKYAKQPLSPNRQNVRVLGLQEIAVEEYDGDRDQILDRMWKYGRFVHVQCKIAHAT